MAMLSRGLCGQSRASCLKHGQARSPQLRQIRIHSASKEICSGGNDPDNCNVITLNWGSKVKGIRIAADEPKIISIRYMYNSGDPDEVFIVETIPTHHDADSTSTDQRHGEAHPKRKGVDGGNPQLPPPPCHTPAARVAVTPILLPLPLSPLRHPPETQGSVPPLPLPTPLDADTTSPDQRQSVALPKRSGVDGLNGTAPAEALNGDAVLSNKPAHFAECLQRLLTEAGLQVLALDIINKRPELSNMALSDLEEKWRCLTSACEVNSGWMKELQEASPAHLSEVLVRTPRRLRRLPLAAPYTTKSFRSVVTMSDSDFDKIDPRLNG